jgi:hypothetical protein
MTTVVMLNVIMPSVAMTGVVRLGVILLRGVNECLGVTKGYLITIQPHEDRADSIA